MSRIGLLNPLVRSVAIASVAGAALLAGSLSPSWAQNTSAAPSTAVKPPAAAAATSSKPETVEQRIQMLKTALKITPDQEAKWTAVATAMRDNASQMEKLVEKSRAVTGAKLTAVEDLRIYQEFAQAHLDGIKHLTSSFKSLYDAMTPDQKKNADQVFQTFGTTPAPSQG